MWRSGTNVGAEGGDQLVVVAIDHDKNSQHALKWAAEHIIGKGQVFILIHVRKKITTIPTPGGHSVPIAEVDEEVAAAFMGHVESKTREIFLPFRCFCSRRALHCKEVILEESDISKAIVEYVTQNSVDKLVLGVSSRNAFLRAFAHADVPTTVSKTAPDFCTVYVISKGKVASVRNAIHPNKHPVNRNMSTRIEADNQASSPRKSVQELRHGPEEVIRAASPHYGRVSPGNETMLSATNNSNPLINDRLTRIPPYNSDPRINDRLERGMTGISAYNPHLRINELTERGGNYLQHLDYSFQSNGSRQSFERTSVGHSFEDFDVHNQFPELSPQHYFSQEASSDSSSLRSFDVRRNDRHWSNASHGSGIGEQAMSPHGSAGNNWSRSSIEDVEMEMQRLKLELKRTMEMYSSACKEALSAKQKAREFQSWKVEEERRLEEAKIAEEAAIELAEREKLRCRAALEAAEAAKRAVEIETRKRLEAERRLLEEGKSKPGDCMVVDLRYRRYTIEELEKATQNFSESHKIGEGGYGPVFRGLLDHTLVAIKALRPDAAQGRQQFQQEVEILSCIRHPNMVLLVGACPEYGCLIYEYMANGSLEDRLFQRGNTPPLSWQLRFRIAAEIATGLLFLHQTKPEPLVHRDLKPANILLDHNFVSKISDVGLARLVPPSVADNVTQYHMTSAAGTFCYIDPEYQQTGMLGIKSDIYALGVILLQLLTAKPPVGIAHHVERAIEKGVFPNLLDPAVHDWPQEDAMSLAKMALRCAELRRKDRPDLGTVVLPELDRLRDLADESMHLLAPGYAHHLHVHSLQEIITARSSGFSSTHTDDSSWAHPRD